MCVGDILSPPQFNAYLRDLPVGIITAESNWRIIQRVQNVSLRFIQVRSRFSYLGMINESIPDIFTTHPRLMAQTGRSCYRMLSLKTNGEEERTTEMIDLGVNQRNCLRYIS